MSEESFEVSGSPNITKSWIIKFRNQCGDQSFRLPQCGCGRLTTRYYEFTPPNTDLTGSYVVLIACRKCFKKMLKFGEILK